MSQSQRDLSLRQMGQALGARARRGAVLAALSLAGCRSFDARVYNLKNLHDEGGLHVREAELVSESSFAVRELLRSLRQSPQSKSAPAPKRVENPPQTCLENLLGLARSKPASPREQALLVAWCTRIAMRDPWTLSRERAVIELGRVGRRLDCSGTFSAEPAASSAASPEQVRDALLVVARTAAREAQLASNPAWQADFGFPEQSADQASVSAAVAEDLPAACQALAQLELDLDGALRALQGLTLVCGHAWERDARFAPTLALALDLERRCVRFALARALREDGRDQSGSDPGLAGPPAMDGATDPAWARVRAAAVEASALARGADFLRELMTAGLEELEPESVTVAGLRALKRHGLPEAASERERRDWIQGMLKLAVQSPDGQVRTWAMRALERATNGEITGLREEAAFQWYQEHGQVEEPGRP